VFKAGVLVISDKGSRGERVDESGPAAQEVLTKIHVTVTKYEIVPDEKKIIAAKLRAWAEKEKLDLIITSGGTGLSPRDVTPEATRLVIDKEIPGITEVMRLESLKKTPFGMLSRAIAGSCGKCLIVNLPGSPKAVRECLGAVLQVIPHALDILAGKTFEGPHDKVIV